MNKLTDADSIRLKPLFNSHFRPVPPLFPAGPPPLLDSMSTGGNVYHDDQLITNLGSSSRSSTDDHHDIGNPPANITCISSSDPVGGHRIFGQAMSPSILKLRPRTRFLFHPPYPQPAVDDMDGGLNTTHTSTSNATVATSNTPTDDMMFGTVAATGFDKIRRQGSNRTPSSLSFMDTTLGCKIHGHDHRGSRGSRHDHLDGSNRPLAHNIIRSGAGVVPDPGTRPGNNLCPNRMGNACDNKGDESDPAAICHINNNNRRPKLCARGHWRPAEDVRLKELVSLYGPQNWNSIAYKIPGRSGKSCRLRWFNQLDPSINKRAFTLEEEEKLLFAHKTQGNKWAMIAKLFRGRTDNAVKNHYHVIMAKKRRQLQHYSNPFHNYNSRTSTTTTSRRRKKQLLLHSNSSNPSSPSSSTISQQQPPPPNNSTTAAKKTAAGCSKSELATISSNTAPYAIDHDHHPYHLSSLSNPTGHLTHLHHLKHSTHTAGTISGKVLLPNTKRNHDDQVHDKKQTREVVFGSVNYNTTWLQAVDQQPKASQMVSSASTTTATPVGLDSINNYGRIPIRDVDVASAADNNVYKGKATSPVFFDFLGVGSFEPAATTTT